MTVFGTKAEAKQFMKDNGFKPNPSCYDTRDRQYWTKAGVRQDSMITKNRKSFYVSIFE